VRGVTAGLARGSGTRERLNGGRLARRRERKAAWSNSAGERPSLGDVESLDEVAAALDRLTYLLTEDSGAVRALRRGGGGQKLGPGQSRVRTELRRRGVVRLIRS